MFGSKASELENSRPVEKLFYLPNIYLAPPMEVIPSEFHRDLLHRKTGVPELSSGIVF